ncbi:hypothetical protein NQ317_001586 [Molorchus minor]|uniref:Uncharacterized protein n=1 Tax=Molorchus minor TaxID=1323400 RepID=A0ABQ9J8M7_9CUCU|nr:hypothetical protein NQ317_001586 [Molorchus minor]
MKLKTKLIYIALLAVILALCMEEVEGRRKVLRGRKTLTRTYLRALAIPAYAIVILIGIGQIILGGILYVVMRKLIIEPPLSGNYSVAPTEA